MWGSNVLLWFMYLAQCRLSPLSLLLQHSSTVFLRKVCAGCGWQMTPLSESSLLACFSSSSEPLTRANSCGAAIRITPTSVRLRRGPHSTEPSVLLGRWVCLLVTTLHRALDGDLPKSSERCLLLGCFPSVTCYHKWPQSWWFKTLEVGSVIAVEDKNELYWGEAQCGLVLTPETVVTWFLPSPSSWPHSSDL